MNARRDQVARCISKAMHSEFGYTNGDLADALIAAGLIVPEGMTAQKLRQMARWIGRAELPVPADVDIIAMRTELLAWAVAVAGSRNAETP